MEWAPRRGEVPPWKRLVAASLTLSLLATSLPPEAWAISSGERGAPPVVIGNFGAAPLVFAVELNAQLDHLQGLPPREITLFAARTINSPDAAPGEKAAARAILGAIARPESFLPSLKAELERAQDPRHPAAGARAAAALDTLPAPSAEALAAALAGLERDVPGTLDELYGAAGRKEQLEDAPLGLRLVEAFYRPRPAAPAAPAPALAPAVLPAADQAAPPAPEPPAPGPAAPVLQTAPVPGPAHKPLSRIGEGQAIKVSFGGWATQLLHPGTWLARLVALGHYRSMKKEMVKVINKLAIPGDSAEFQVRLKPNPDPNAMVQPETAFMWVHLGLLSMTADEDEFASVIAHELTHANPDQLTAVADDPEIAKMLESLDGYKDLRPDQREELRADLGSLERMIKAGYNPWGAYRLEKKLTKLLDRLYDLKVLKHLFKFIFKSSFDYHEAHPAGEIRMAAIKAYILRRGYKEDMTDLTSAKTSLPLSVFLLRQRLRPLTYAMTSPWLWRYWIAKVSFSLVLFLVGLVSKKAAGRMDEAARSGLGAAGDWLGSAWDAAKEHFFGPIKDRALGPVYDHALAPAGRGIATGVGWLWDQAWRPWDHLFPGIGHAEALFTGFFIVLLPLLAVAVSYRSYRKALASDAEAYAKLVRVRGDLGPLRASLRKAKGEGTLADAQLLELIERSKARLHDVENLYQYSKMIRRFRWVDGLSWGRLRWLTLHRELLAELNGRLRGLDEGDRAEAVGPALEKLLDVPAFAFEDAGVREELSELVALTRHELARGHRLSLMALAQGVGPATPPEVVFDLARELAAKDLRDTARRIFDGNYQRILDFITSQRHVILSRAWVAIERTLRNEGTLMPATYRGRLRRDAMLLWARLRRSFRGLPELMAIAALSAEIPSANWRLLSLRRWVEFLDMRAIRLAIGWRFSSVLQLGAFVENELRARGVILEHHSLSFHAAILANPGWIRTKADLDALVEEEAFWPTFGKRSAGFLEGMLITAVRIFSVRFPDQWRFEPGASEKLHALYLSKLADLGLSPATFGGRLALWKTLTSRGVTSATDRAFAELYAEAPEAEKPGLEDLALAGRLWDQPVKAGIVERQVKASWEYKSLLGWDNPGGRKTLLENVIKAVSDRYPEKGIFYARMLESISREIRSTPAESALIEEAKKPGKEGEKSEDFGLRFLSHLTSEALGWRKSQQWALIQFLRGDIPPTRKIRRAFRTVGPERVRRFYDLLPVAARTGLLDQFMDSPRGLLANKVNLKSGYPRKIMDRLLPQGDPEARRVAHEILEAFLYSLEKTGNEGFQSYVLSYMLSLPKDETSSIGRTLKGVLEIFGASGVKIGQFLAASGLLPDEETKALRELQERALEPDREGIYADLREITDRKDFPFKVEELLGSASIKYAFRVTEEGSREPLVMKVFRLSAIAHTRLEFSQLDHMARYLTKNYGAQYGVFRAIVKAAKRAVERELSSKNEVAQSQVAREKIYAGKGDAESSVAAPRDVLLHPRLIASEFARGTSIFKLAPEHRSLAARKILELEGGIFFADADVIRFDPDRHPGNYRLEVVVTPDGPKVFVRPIDPGQGLSMTRAERERVFELFALSQVLKDAGSSAWATAELSRILDLEPLLAAKLKRRLAAYFPAEGLRPVAAYYSVLAALDEAGLELPIVYFDYVRGIIQLRQYEDLAPGYSPTPRERLEAEVTRRAKRMAAGLRLSKAEKAGIGAHRFWEALKRAPFAGAAVAAGASRRGKRLGAALLIAAALFAATTPWHGAMGRAAQAGWERVEAAYDGVHWPWDGARASLRKKLRDAPEDRRSALIEDALLSRDAPRVMAAVDLAGAEAERENPKGMVLIERLADLARDEQSEPAARRAAFEAVVGLYGPAGEAWRGPELAPRELASVLLRLAEFSQTQDERLGALRRLVELSVGGRLNYETTYSDLRDAEIYWPKGPEREELKKEVDAFRDWRNARWEEIRSEVKGLEAILRSDDAAPQERLAAFDDYLRGARRGDVSPTRLEGQMRGWFALSEGEARRFILRNAGSLVPLLDERLRFAYSDGLESIAREDSDAEARRLAKIALSKLPSPAPAPYDRDDFR